MPSQRCPLLLLLPKRIPLCLGITSNRARTSAHSTHLLASGLVLLGWIFWRSWQWGRRGLTQRGLGALLHEVPVLFAMGIAPEVFSVTGRIVFSPTLNNLLLFLMDKAQLPIPIGCSLQKQAGMEPWWGWISKQELRVEIVVIVGKRSGDAHSFF